MHIPHKQFYFVRHGQTDWNFQNKRMGWTDLSLNNVGISQAHEIAQVLKNIDIVSIAVSPLVRAVTTAHIISQCISKPVHIIENLKECCWGIMEGQDKNDRTLLEEWYKDKEIQGAESFSAFIHRVRSGLISALELPGPVLIVAHGGVYRAIQESLLLPPVILSNCSAMYHMPPAHAAEPWKRCVLGGQSDQI